MIKPRYLGPLVREELVHDFIIEKTKESQSKFKSRMDANDINAASYELGKQEALLDVLRFINNMVWY